MYLFIIINLRIHINCYHSHSKAFSCKENREFHSCKSDGENGNDSKKNGIGSPFRSMLFVDQLWIIQVIFLFLSYFAVLRYDRLQI